MITINLSDIERDLPDMLARINAGETVLIIHENQPIAELKPLTHSSKQWRPSGLCAGEFTVPHDFDTPLPDAVLVEFEGG